MISQAKTSASPYSPGLWDRITEVLKTNRTGEIADLLEISPSSVSDWKHGRTVPSVERLGSIAFYGDTTIEYLIAGEVEKRYQEGDTTYFEIWFLKADYRRKLETLASAAGKPLKVMAQELLTDAIDRAMGNGQQSEYEALLRRIVRDEISKGRSRDDSVGPIEPGEMIWAPDMGTVTGGEDIIDEQEVKKKRKTG